MHSVAAALFGSYVAGATRKLVISVHSVCAIQPCTMSRHFMQTRNMRGVHACIAVTSCMHFWQNDRDVLGATAIAMTKSAVEVTKNI